MISLRDLLDGIDREVRLKQLAVESGQSFPFSLRQFIAVANACLFPQSNATARTVFEELQSVAANQQRCTSFYLDTLESQSNPNFGLTEGEDHHQGLARTHLLSDGSVYFFLSHSEVDPGDKGNLMQFRYAGPTDGEHIVQTSPLTVAPMSELLQTEEQHPCDMVFLPDVNNADSGYLFVAEQQTNQVAVYQWAPGANFAFVGSIPHESPGPNLIFLDRVEKRYFLGIGFVSDAGGSVRLYSASPVALFPGCRPGHLNLAAFQPTMPESIFPLPVSNAASQVHLLRDASGQWFLLAFRGDPPDKEDATDFVDVHGIEFGSFNVTSKIESVHITFSPGDTSFASTGTHYVEKSGRLLISSSYRWSEDEGPGDSSFVSRVDECPS